MQEDKAASLDHQIQKMNSEIAISPSKPEETLIDLKSMPTFRDKPIKQDSQSNALLEWPMRVAYADVPMREITNDTTQEDCFVWPPASMSDCLADEDMLVWLACQTPDTMQSLFPLNPKLTREH